MVSETFIIMKERTVKHSATINFSLQLGSFECEILWFWKTYQETFSLQSECVVLKSYT